MTAPIFALLSIGASFSAARWGGADQRRGSLRSGLASSALQRMFSCPRLLEVAGDLADEIRLARERPLVAEPPPELDDQPLAVEVALVVEQERLDAQLRAAVVRVDADRGGRAVAGRRPGVDPVRGHEQVRLDLDVGGRESERAAPRVTAHTDAVDLDGPAQQRRGPVD